MHMKLADSVARFESHTRKVGDCHIWQSTIKRDGYGQFWLDGKPQKAHRVAYSMANGEIPNGMCVLHRCDVKECVNPEHLFIGSLKDNVRDMDKKGRRGTRAALTKRQAKQVLGLLDIGLSQATISILFSVHQTSVSRAKHSATTEQQYLGDHHAFLRQ